MRRLWPLAMVQSTARIDFNPFFYHNAFRRWKMDNKTKDMAKRILMMVLGNDERLQLVSLFDNLGKGSSGAAVQCLNLMLGLRETDGLVLA